MGKVVPISTASNKAGRPISVGRLPAMMALTPDGKTLYVSSSSGRVTPIRTATGQAGKPIKADDTTGLMVVAPNGKAVYVISSSGLIRSISTATGKTGQPISVGAIRRGGPNDLAITPDGRTLYVIEGVEGANRQVVPISTVTNKVGKANKVRVFSTYIAFAG